MSEAENNKMIAEFMGYKYETGISLGGSWHRFYKINGTFEDSFPNAKYHTSWDWLMPVVEKIESVGYGVTIDSCVCEIYKHGRDYATKVADTKLSATYQAVCSFIKQRNHE